MKTITIVNAQFCDDTYTLLISALNLEVSDTTNDDSSNYAGYIIINLTFKELLLSKSLSDLSFPFRGTGGIKYSPSSTLSRHNQQLLLLVPCK